MNVRLLFVCLLMQGLVWGQSPIFKKGDRVCFVGNSITNNGEFYHNIYLYYVTRFPNQPITFFNCGISGDVCSGVLRRMDWDILSHNPTHAVIKLGMNDVMRSNYGIFPTTNPDTLKKRAEAIATYKVKLDTIIKIFLAKNIKVILQKPTIFDQTAHLKRENNLGVNDALKECADYIQTLADKYHVPVIDYWTILNQINNSLQEKDSTATIIGKDRIHPGADGHLIMAYQFLTTTQSPKTVATLVIDKDIKQSNKLSKNSNIINLSYKKGEISFEAKEAALPFPSTESQQLGMSLVPFTKDLSEEKLVIKKLPAANMKLLIDDSLIGNFSAANLDSGINLGMYRNTPQYKQALDVKNILNKLWKVEGSLRTIKYVEFKHLDKYKGDKQDLAALKAYLDDLFRTKLSDNNYYKLQFDNYIKLKPTESQLQADLINFQEAAYQAAQTVSHRFKLVAVE